MTYDAFENSAAGGQPIELYEFRRNGDAFRFTSAATDQTYAGATWKRAVLTRNNTEQGGDLNRAGLTIRAPRNFLIADLYRVTPPTEPLQVVLRQLHAGDTEAAVVWSGRVTNVDFSGSEATINCEPVLTSLRRIGLRRLYQTQCPHVLYGPQCGVSKPGFGWPAVVDSVNGAALTSTQAAEKPNGYFDGGYIEWVASANATERRLIVSHLGSQINLPAGITGLPAGAAVTLYPGCDHTLTTCHTKYNNAPNYGGFPYIPTKNPFGGTPIY